MSSLFILKDNYKQIYELIADQEDEQILKDTLDSINDALEDKADGYVAVIKSLETDNNAIDEEIKRLKQRKTSNENGIKRLKETLQQVMEETGKEKFKTALNSYSIANNPPSLEVKDKNVVPKEFFTEQEPKLNKKELLKAVKEGLEIKGIELKQSRSLRVR
ncbi:siphovirus Gp157 family protein [Staphylococcus capitis]|uniref:siphovirus Gp157 family protein n=1 Tax=Staphylococcus capitis TaxID=29388 RepID=UPI0018888EB2|nr:siphovirus Gp157 family protein [Staphylococcus capitis]MBF2260833.1 siphovirus Gp157 family protein [Staphylococcus capitis]MBF2281243.1 siphovirus Gp157 family protein [Staphylococcus capitis]